MNIIQKYIFCFVSVIILFVFTASISFAITGFHLSTDSTNQKIGCRYVEINKNQIKCTEGKIIVKYKLSNISSVEFVNEGKTYKVEKFTKENIERINNINLENIKEKKDKAEAVNLSFTQSIKRKFSHYVGNSTIGIIVQVVGIIVLIIGNFAYLIATFRVGVLWGLSCMFLPFVSFIFLFVHWKKAAKPFFISLAGLALIISGALFTSPSGAKAQIIKPVNTASIYSCRGKIHCSEMTSCAEAKFYLRNCRGTKIDGDSDGVPCEKQWCNQ